MPARGLLAKIHSRATYCIAKKEGEMRRWGSISGLSRITSSRIFGFGALVLTLVVIAQPAQARIVYTPTHEVIDDGGSLSIDVNHDGTTDFTIGQYFSWSPPCIYTDTTVAPAPSDGVIWSYSSPRGIIAAAIPSGVPIGAAQPFVNVSVILEDLHSGPDCPFAYSDGYWLDGNPHYFGFEFVKNGKTRYGWAQVTVVVVNNRFVHSVTATLSGYAYQTNVGQSIPAGKT
jgi:hypothetical protein